MKKLLLFLLLCFVILGAGCGNKGSDLNPNNPVTLTMWHVYGSQTKSPLNDSIAYFNETEGKQKGIIIKVASVSNSLRDQGARLRTHAGPIHCLSSHYD